MDELLDDAPCGFAGFTDDGYITTVNKTLAEWLGYNPGELAGRHIETLLTLSSRIFYQTHFFPLIVLHGKAEEVFMMLKAKDGTDVPCLLNAKRKQDDSRAVNYCACIPVHERRKYEDELLKAKKTAEEALHRNDVLVNMQQELETHKQELDRQVHRLITVNKELAEFSTVISHDAQEPIRRMIMFSDIVLAQQRGNLTAESDTSLRKIRTLAERMRNMLTALNQFVAMDVTPHQPERADLKEILEIARLKLIATLPLDATQIDCDNLPQVEGYPALLELMFFNLLQNAVKFRQPERELRIRISCDVIQQNSYKAIKGKYRYIDFVRISFSDNGMGFPNKYDEYIFRLFKKLDPETHGLGFGLALCRKIAERHHGSITARGTPGEGAQFTIILPLKQD